MLDGKKIKTALKSAGIDAKTLAEDVGISPAMMCFIINGKRDTTISVAHRIAERLGCTLDELIKKGR